MQWATAVLVAALAGPIAGANPTVKVSEGTVIGTTTKLPSATGAVRKFLSIPYAKTPPERFLPPKKQSKWRRPLLAQDLPPACIQYFPGPSQSQNRTKAIFNNPGSVPPPESEDCLYLNIYTPPDATQKSRLPVLFWLYGGAFQFGASALDFYDGSSFAYNHDVVVVTINYRTNVFGFPNANQLPLSKQNAGLHDQRAALQWTHENIAEFGGDSSKITIFGESAGADSVKYLLSLPPSPRPFRAAIMESEALLPSLNGSLSWEAFLAGIGCATAASPFKCAQKAEVSSIRDFLNEKTFLFLPVADGATCLADIRPAVRDGSFAKVPLILGSNQDEGRPFAYIFGFDGPQASLDSLLDVLVPNNPILKKTIEAAFANQSVFFAASEIIKLLLLQCPTAQIAGFLQSHGYPAYRYLFNASFPDTTIFPNAGVWHSSEIPEVFGTYPLRNSLGEATAQQIRLSKYMQKVWAEFAKKPTAGPVWPAYGPSKKIADIGANGISGHTIVHSRSVDQQCALFDPLIAILGL